MKIITDTNFWYDFAAGSFSKISPDWVLCPTPINFVEIISKIDNKNYADRKSALLVMRKYIKNMCVTGEKLLDDYFDIKNENNKTDYPYQKWVDIFCQSSDLATATLHFEQDSDYANISQSLFLDWRKNEWESFAQGVIKIIVSNNHNQPYLVNGQIKYLNEASLSGNHPLFLKLNSSDFFTLSLRGLIGRAQGHIPTDADVDSFKINFPNEIKKISGYINVYNFYIRDCATKRSPKKNDWADLELFIYADGDCNTRIATSDNRWIEISKKAGISPLVIDLNQYKIP